jgi:hypothetical protein
MSGGPAAAAAATAGSDQVSAMARLLEAGLCHLADLAPAAAAVLLPKVVHLLVPLVRTVTQVSAVAVTLLQYCGRLRSLLGSSCSSCWCGREINQ